MSDPKNALALHLLGVPEPLLIAVDEATAAELSEQLAAKLLEGKIESLIAANGNAIVVNFDKVVAAHVGTAPPLGQLYGSVSRR